MTFFESIAIIAFVRGLTLTEWKKVFRERWSKGPVLAEALFRQYYRTGRIEPDALPEFSRSGDLGSRIVKDLEGSALDGFYSGSRCADETEGTIKFVTRLKDSLTIESVILPMKNYNTLCVSSQAGCGRGCLFCRTGKMGIQRNLSAAEIVDQVQTARFVYDRPIENIVFMGMGEPLDNLNEVLTAVEILSEPKGNPVHRKNISLSTCGVVSGIRHFTELTRLNPEKGYHHLVLSLSLHSADPEIRSRLMPGASEGTSLDELKQVLMETPQAGYRNKLFFEYVLIPGVNDSERDAQLLLSWLDGLPGKVNLIPWNPVEGLKFRSPTETELRQFWQSILRGGRSCLVRISRGDAICAACGQLGPASLPL